MPNQPVLNAPAPSQHKLDILRQHFPQAIETDTQGHIRINAAALQLALDPSNRMRNMAIFQNVKSGRSQVPGSSSKRCKTCPS